MRQAGSSWVIGETWQTLSRTAKCCPGITDVKVETCKIEKVISDPIAARLVKVGYVRDIADCDNYINFIIILALSLER